MPADVDVELVETVGGYSGVVRIAGGAPREVASTTCAEAVDALSFVVALAFDPEASAPERSPEPVRAPPASRPAAERSIAERASPPREVAHEPSRSTRFAFGALVETGSLAGPTLGGRLYLALKTSGATFAPALRLSVGRTLPSVVEGERRALLTFTDIELEGCALAFPASRPWLRACAFGAFGAVASEGRTAVPRSDVNPWGAVGLSAPLELALGSRFSVELRPSVGRTVYLDRFYAEPDFTVYEAPILFAKVGVGLALHVP